MSGIVGYGVYIPRYRLKLSEIAQMWQKNPDEITAGLKVSEKQFLHLMRMQLRLN